MELSSSISALNPANSFAAFDTQMVCKVQRLVEFYPKDFSSDDLIHLKLQVHNYIDDMKKMTTSEALEILLISRLSLVK